MHSGILADRPAQWMRDAMSAVVSKKSRTNAALFPKEQEQPIRDMDDEEDR